MASKDKKIVLGVVGEIAAGKGELTSYLAKKYGALAYRSSEALRDVLKRMYLKEERRNIQKVSTMIREFFGSDIISKINKLDVENAKENIVAIDGLRRESDFAFFKKDFNFKVIYVEADIEKRFERLSRRQENVDDNKKTLEEFKKDHLQEAEKDILSLKEKADYVIQNNGSLEEFHKEIDNLINKIKK